jgi:hypothetical protein
MDSTVYRRDRHREQGIAYGHLAHTVMNALGVHGNRSASDVDPVETGIPPSGLAYR